MYIRTALFILSTVRHARMHVCIYTAPRMYVACNRAVQIILYCIAERNIRTYVRMCVCTCKGSNLLQCINSAVSLSGYNIQVCSMASSDAWFPSSYRKCLFGVVFEALKWSGGKCFPNSQMTCGLDCSLYVPKALQVLPWICSHLGTALDLWSLNVHIIFGNHMYIWNQLHVM